MRPRARSLLVRAVSTWSVASAPPAGWKTTRGSPGPPPQPTDQKTVSKTKNGKRKGRVFIAAFCKNYKLWTGSKALLSIPPIAISTDLRFPVLWFLRALRLLIALTAGTSDTAVSEHRHYGGQHQKEEQKNNQFNWHCLSPPKGNSG